MSQLTNRRNGRAIRRGIAILLIFIIAPAS